VKKPKSLGGQTRLSDPLDIRDVARAHNPALGSDVICETRALQAAVIPAKAGIYDVARAHNPALGSDVICETRALQAAVIPAKAGIYSANLRKCAVDGLDSRFRGNDCAPNDTTTRRFVPFPECIREYIISGMVEGIRFARF
jgi:hypothetical protein